MSTPLYLTAEERTVFEKLPADLRRNWIVMDETLTCYETERQLKIRRDIFRKKDPAFVRLLEKLGALKEPVSIEKLTEEVGPVPQILLMDIFFTMGAGFLRDCILAILSAAQPDVSALAECAGLRHLLLESNSKPVS